MTVLATRTIKKTKSSGTPISSKSRDKTAAETYIDAYGNFIWALAQKCTASREEAQAAAHEIFIDMWLFAERRDWIPSTEEMLSSLIARRRLISYLQ